MFPDMGPETNGLMVYRFEGLMVAWFNGPFALNPKLQT